MASNPQNISKHIGYQTLFAHYFYYHCSQMAMDNRNIVYSSTGVHFQTRASYSYPPLTRTFPTACELLLLFLPLQISPCPCVGPVPFFPILFAVALLEAIFFNL